MGWNIKGFQGPLATVRHSYSFYSFVYNSKAILIHGGLNVKHVLLSFYQALTEYSLCV